MTRVSLRAWLAVVAAVTLLSYIGCSSSDSTKSSPTVVATSSRPTTPEANSPKSDSPKSDSPAEARAKATKLPANWPVPAAVLVVSGEMDGYLEPCGCAQGQLGGLIRRLDFVDKLRAQNWPVALIDLGSLIKDPASSRGGSEQAKIKFGIALKAFTALKYNAVALTAEDLKVGIGEAFAQFLNNMGDSTRIVVANVQPGPGFETRIQPSQIIKIGPVNVGVTSVIDPEVLTRLTDPDKADLLPTIKQPDEVLGAVLAELEPKSQFQVLMVQGSPELAKRLATAFPGFDVVLATSQFADLLEREPVMLNDGKTMMIQVGKRGKYVGAVGFFPDDAQKLRFHLVTLDNQNDKAGSPMKKIIEDEYRSMLKAAGIVESFPRHEYTGGTAGATFVGAETCKRCHPKTYMKWSTTKHAQAFVSLEKDPKPDVTFDAECVSCHTTGFEYNSGFRSAAATPHLKGNQCENCHAPGSKHVSDPNNREFRKPMKVSAEQADKSQLCSRCHDEDNSPKFEFKTYWSQIVHNGLDDYSDPKVRRGITPKVARTPDGTTEK